MTRLLTIDGSGAQASVAIVSGGEVVAERRHPGAHGQSALLAPMAANVLAEAGLAAAVLDGVAAIVGPGGFTGLRAALALAHGIAFAAAIPIIGVTLAEAFAAAVPARDGRCLWTAIDSRRGRVFLHDGETFRAVMLDDLTSPPGLRIAVAGDAAVGVAAALAARGRDVVSCDARHPRPRDIACAALRRMAGTLAPLAARPLYIDPPEAKPPASGPRPPPTEQT